MKEKYLKTLFIFIIVCVCINLDAQTIIRERVKIKPNSISAKLMKTEVDYPPLEFQIGGPLPFSASISGPGGSASGSGGGGTQPFWFASLTAINGVYSISIDIPLDPGQISNIEAVVSWNGQGYFIDGRDIRNDSDQPLNYKFYSSFTFNEIPVEPPKPPFDYSIQLSNYSLYGTEESLIIFNGNRDQDSLHNVGVLLHFESDCPGLTFYDIELQQNLGVTLTTTLNRSNKYSIKTNTLDIGNVKNVKVIAVADDLTRMDSLTISPLNRVYAYFEKQSLSPKDTVNIIIKKINRWGWESDYPDTTHFEIGIKKGCGMGLIMDASGNKKDYFKSIQQPLRFVVADSLGTEADSVIVLNVGAPVIAEEIIWASKIVKGNDNLSEAAANYNSRIFTSKKLTTITRETSEDVCMIYTPKFMNSFDVKSKYLLEILQPTEKTTDETISKIPQMPVVICKAKLKNYYGGNIRFEWEYWVSKEYKRFELNGDTLCRRISKSTFGGISHASNNTITEWTVPFVKDSLKNFYVRASLPSRNSKYHQKYGGDCYEEISSWNYGNDVFTGGYVWVKVIAYDKDGNWLAEKNMNANKISGVDENGKVQNPKLNDVLNAAATLKAEAKEYKKIQAIILIESKTRHFVDTIKTYKNGLIINQIKGFPSYGPPNGFGLMQIDNKPATELQLWNWKANLKAGSDLFFVEKTRIALDDLKGHVPTDDEILLATFSRYNGDSYYLHYDSEMKQWIRKPLDSFNKWGVIDDKPYAERVMEKYNELLK